MVWTVRKVDVDPSYKFWAAGGGHQKKYFFQLFLAKKIKFPINFRNDFLNFPEHSVQLGRHCPGVRGTYRGAFLSPICQKIIQIELKTQTAMPSPQVLATSIFWTHLMRKTQFGHFQTFQTLTLSHWKWSLLKQMLVRISYFCIQILFWWWWWRSGGRKQRGC